MGGREKDTSEKKRVYVPKNQGTGSQTYLPTMVFRDIYPFFFRCVFFPTYPTSVSTDTNRSKGHDPKPTYLPWFFGTYTRFFSDVSFSLPILPPFLQIPIDPRDRIPNLPTYHGFSGHIPVFFQMCLFPYLSYLRFC